MEIQSSSNRPVKSIAAVAVVVLLFGAFYLTLTRVDTFLKNQAIDQCGQIARQEQVTEAGKVSYPLTDIYETCLERKGIN